jgi:hypothetical protein
MATHVIGFPVFSMKVAVELISIAPKLPTNSICKWNGSNADLFTLNHRPSNAMCFHMQGPRVLSMTAVSFCAFHPCAVAMNMPMSTV